MSNEPGEWAASLVDKLRKVEAECVGVVAIMEQARVRLRELIEVLEQDAGIEEAELAMVAPARGQGDPDL